MVGRAFVRIPRCCAYVFLTAVLLSSIACKDKANGASAEAGASAAASPVVPSTSASSSITAAAQPTPGAEEPPAGCDLKGPIKTCEDRCLAGNSGACGFSDAWLRKLAETGGDDPVMRAKLNKKGCDLGSLKSCSRLARQYEKGDGLPPDASRAISLWQTTCDGGYANACRSLGAHYGFDRTDGAQDLAKALVWFQKGCQGGDSDDCKSVREIQNGEWFTDTTIADLVSDPGRWTGKHVILTGVAAIRASPSSGTIFPRGGSPSTDGISVVVANDPDARKKWFTFVHGYPGTNVKSVEGTTEAVMSRTGGLRLVLLDMEP